MVPFTLHFGYLFLTHSHIATEKRSCATPSGAHTARPKSMAVAPSAAARISYLAHGMLEPSKFFGGNRGFIAMRPPTTSPGIWTGMGFGRTGVLGADAHGKEIAAQLSELLHRT